MWNHRDLQSVNNYSTASSEQKKKCLWLWVEILQKPVSCLRSGVAIECFESSLMKSSGFPAAGPFNLALFHGGQFNITMNTVNKSPTSTDHSTQSTRARSFKRIKRVFESSDEDSPPQRQTKLYWLTNFGLASFVILKRAVPYLIKNWNACYPLHQLWFLFGDIFTSVSILVKF